MKILSQIENKGFQDLESKVESLECSGVVNFTPTFTDYNGKTMPTWYETGHYIKQGNLVYLHVEIELGDVSEGGPYAGIAYINLPASVPAPLKNTYLTCAGYQSMSFIGGVGELITNKRITIRRPTDSFNGPPVMASAIPNSAYIMVWGYYFCE